MSAVPVPVEMPGPPALVVARNISLRIGRKLLLDQIDLEIAEGEFICVIGPSGCGKTTLARVIAGLVAPTGGAVAIGDAPMDGPRLDVAMVFQDYGKALLPWRTAAQNIDLALEAIAMPQAQRAAEITRLLQLMGLADHAHKFPAQLSGGMQQRLQIARCLAQKPRVLVMDEPFGALDAMTRESLQDELLALSGREKMTVVFVTHDLDEAIYMSDRVVALQANPGRIARTIEVDVPRPRDHLLSKEHPAFLRLRHELYEFFRTVQHGTH